MTPLSRSRVGRSTDSVRSSVKTTVYVLLEERRLSGTVTVGPNLVVLTLRVQPPCGGMPIALPVKASLHRKENEKTILEHAGTAPMPLWPGISPSAST